MTLKHPPPARPGPTGAPAPMIAPTGNMTLDAMADVVNNVAAPFETAPDPAKGTVGAVTHYVSASLAAISMPMAVLDTGVAMATAKVSALFPGMAAATLGTPYIGPPHIHNHPPSLVPPAPPVPLPSLGAVSVAGCLSVLIEGVPAARSGDLVLAPTCGGLFPIGTIATGSSSVWIGGARAARRLDIVRVCAPGGKMGKLDKAMTAVGAAGTVCALVDAAVTPDPQRAIVAAAHAAADAAAMAAGLLTGKDPSPTPLPGVLMPTGGSVKIGGFPMPDTMAALGGLAKVAKKLVKGIRGGRRAGKLFCLKC